MLASDKNMVKLWKKYWNKSYLDFCNMYDINLSKFYNYIFRKSKDKRIRGYIAEFLRRKIKSKKWNNHLNTQYTFDKEKVIYVYRKRNVSELVNLINNLFKTNKGFIVLNFMTFKRCKNKKIEKVYKDGDNVFYYNPNIYNIICRSRN